MANIKDVNSKGEAVKKKKTSSYGFKKKPAGKKDLTAVVAKKPVRKIVEYFYFTDKEINCRDLLNATGPFDPKSDIWPDLNLMEVVMGYDSLIFQDATECFIDEEDMKWFEAQGIKTKYQVSYDTGDIAEVRKALKQIMGVLGGVICSDTDDFMPCYKVEDLDKLQ